jgi:aspartate racemase
VPALVEYLLASVRRLAAAGVDFVAMTANTPHIVFDEVAAGSPVPMVSIVETCAEAAAARRLERPLLLGTRYTMEASFYPEVFERRGIEICTPGAEDRGWLHGCYVEELLRGKFLEETRERVLGLVERRRDLGSVDGVILGGTELPLLLPEETIAGLPVLDTTALHVAGIIRRLRG